MKTRQALRSRGSSTPRSSSRGAPSPRNRPKSTHAPTPERIFQFAWGYAPPLILETAVNLRVFDRLEAAPKTAEALAKETGASVRGLKALLDALVGFEFLKRKGPRYALTPESDAFLVSTKPSFHGGFFRHMVRQVMPTWMRLNDAVTTGRPVTAVNAQDQGADFFAEFVEGIFPMSYRAAQTLGQHLRISDLASPASVLDIGAGSGVWGIAVAQQSPHVSILAVDWPKVLKVTEKIAHRHGLRHRLKTSAGDLLKADFGRSHHLATIGHILHSEGPARSRRLLKKVFDALKPGGTIAISEFMPHEDRTGPPSALIFAVNMLVHTTEGNTFTFKEMSRWLREAGFRNPRLLEAPAPSPLVLATKPLR